MLKVVREAVDEIVSDVRKNLSEEILNLIDLAETDLYAGPLYIDEDGEVVSMWDEGAVPFNFSKATKTISEALDDIDIDDIYVDDMGEIYKTDPQFDDLHWDEETDEYIGPLDYYIIEREYILKELLGKELANYIR